jgi:Cu2+-exporting ATPase
VIAGSHNLSGMLLVRVERAGSETRYAAMVALMEQASVQKPRLARIADRIAGPFVFLVLLASAGAAFWWWPSDPVHAIGVAIAVLIVTCPCALSLATPAATLAAAGALARRGVLVRRLEALESCAVADTVVFDKTGTLTEDRMTVTVSRTREGLDPAQALLMASALAQHSLHPLSRAIVQAVGTEPMPATGVTEVSGQGLQGHVVCGANESPRFMRLGSATFCGIPVPTHASHGPQVHLSDEAGWLASFDMDEALRPDAGPAVSALRMLGLQVQLLSGDLMAAVARLAARAGVDEAYGQRTPEAKLAHVRGLQQRGRRVVMVGDGMNDGPVLACADVSVAMGQAVPLAQAKSDFIVLGGQLAAVAALLRHARRTHTIVRQNLCWAALYNAVCVPLAVLGFMPPWLAGLGMAASSLLVVLNSARLARMPEAF